MELWIARDYDDTITLFANKPECDEDGDWISADGCFIVIRDESFPEVTFENSPRKAEIKLVEE